MFKVQILKKDAGVTIFEYLKNLHVATNKINHFLLSNELLINNKPVKEKDYLLKVGDVINIITDYYDTMLIKPIYGELEILYEDDYLLAVNKPKDLIIYADDSKVKTLDNLVQSYCEINNLNVIPRHLHRLDKDTTGVILYAKDLVTESAMNYLFESRQICKKYAAKVVGEITEAGTIDAPIGRDRHINNKMVISKTGQSAVTHYKPIRHNEKTTVVECVIETGRTHQVRLHMASIGHPVIGDPIYNKNYRDFDDLHLHCMEMSFIHPFTGEEVIITSDPSWK